MSSVLVLEATSRRSAEGRGEVHRFALEWSSERCFVLARVGGREQPWAWASGLVTGEHVQYALEVAGYWLEAASLDELFRLDDRVRSSEPPVFLVRDGGTQRVGLSTTVGRLIGPVALVEPASGLSLSLATARSLLQAAAPVGYLTLTSSHLAAGGRGRGIDEVGLFRRAIDRVWPRQGVLNVREVQSWAIARAEGNPHVIAPVEARLRVGAGGFWTSAHLAAAISALREAPGPEAPRLRQSVRRAGPVGRGDSPMLTVVREL